MHVVIVGNGVAGVTAALRLRRNQPDWRITIVSGESTYHYSRPALMYLFMGQQRYADVKPFEDSTWRERRLELVRDWVVGGDLGRKELRLHRGGRMTFDRLLLATGSKPNRFGWPGQDLEGVQGLYGLPDLVRLHRSVERTHRAVIVGGGLIGVELAEMLLARRIAVTLLAREGSYWDNVLPAEESALVNAEVRAHGVDLRLGTELVSIEDDGNGRCAAALTGAGERIVCQLVGLTAGVSPNLDLARELGLDLARGVLVDPSLRTAVPDVLAAGDCAEIVLGAGRPNLLQQVWYTGRMQGEVAGDVLAGRTRTYDPGIWYNSAKFFELEYQVYGRVNQDVPDESGLLWVHRTQRKSLRLVHTPEEGVIGINAMGLRLRHRVCERWIAERRSPRFVLEHLDEVWFDPEFAPRDASEIRAELTRRASAHQGSRA